MVPNIKSQDSLIEDAACFTTFSLFDGTIGKLYGVFDGHNDGGVFSQGAKSYLAQELPSCINRLKPTKPDHIQETLTQICLECDALPELHAAAEQFNCGTTATCCLEIGNSIYIFNVGDSRALLVQKRGTAWNGYQLTDDADPKKERFREELKDAGVNVFGGRVDGRLATARDLGIGFVSPIPDVVHIQRNISTSVDDLQIGYQTGDYLIIATDGFWDVCRNSEAVEALVELEKQGKSLEEISKELAYRARIAGSRDDITVLISKL